MKTKVASLLKPQSESEIVLWLKTLPVIVEMKTEIKILKKAKNSSFILWRDGLGFRFFK